MSQILDKIFRDRCRIKNWTTFVSDIGQKNFYIFWTNIILMDIGHLQMYFLPSHQIIAEPCGLFLLNVLGIWVSRGRRKGKMNPFELYLNTFFLQVPWLLYCNWSTSGIWSRVKIVISWVTSSFSFSTFVQSRIALSIGHCAQVMPKICPRYARDMPKICPSYT